MRKWARGPDFAVEKASGEKFFPAPPLWLQSPEIPARVSSSFLVIVDLFNVVWTRSLTSFLKLFGPVVVPA